MITTVDFHRMNGVSTAPRVSELNRLTPLFNQVEVTAAKRMFPGAALLASVTQGLEAKNGNKTPQTALQSNREFMNRLKDMQQSFGSVNPSTKTEMFDVDGVILGKGCKLENFGFAKIPNPAALDIYPQK